MSKTTIRNVIIALLLIAGAAAGFGLMVFQVIAQSSQLNTQIEALEAERAQEASYYRLQRISEESSADREQLGNYFLFKQNGNVDLLDLLNKVEALATESGITLKTDFLDVVTDTNDRTEWVQADFSFLGSRERVQHFIEVLENLPHVSRIMQIDMNARSSTEWSVKLSMRVRVLAYDE